MKPLHRKKAVALYENRLGIGYIIRTVIFYVLAAFVWILVAMIAPYMATVTVSESRNIVLTRHAFSATDEQIALDEDKKERALLMPTSVDSFLRRLRLIEDAENTVDCLIFDTYEGTYSEYYYTALIKAAERGVKVRIVQDGKLGRLDGSLEWIGKIINNHDNIELYYFNNFNLFNPGAIMTLMHDKLTVVDGNKMIVGGVNIGTGSYLSNYDMEVMVTNSDMTKSVGQAEAYYNQMIDHDITKRHRTEKRDHSAKSSLLKQYSDFYDNSEIAAADVDYSEQGVAVDKITFLTNPIDYKKKAPVIYRAMCNMMESSEKSIIVTPYTLLQNDKKDEIKKLASGNTEFTLITNSLYNSRNVGYADYANTRKDYLNSNIKLMEFQDKNQLHCKMFSFDDRFSVIGSFNLDERSIHIDTECVVVIDSKAFNTILNDYINKTFLSNSLQVGNDNEYVADENITAHYPTASKRFKYFIYGALGVVRCLI